MSSEEAMLHYPLVVRLISLFQQRENDGLTAAERRYHAQQYARKVGYQSHGHEYHISAKMIA